MVTRKTDKAKLTEIAAKGYPIDFAALDATFNFTVSPVTTYGVDVSSFNAVAQRLKTLIRGSEFACELADIVAIPFIRAGDVPNVDKVSFRRSENACFVKKTIDHDEWASAKAKARKAIVEKFLLEVIQAVPAKHLSGPSREELTKLVDAAARGQAQAGR
jgi:hypothetical protein